MSVPQLCNRAARRIFLDRHALSDSPQGPSDSAALRELIKQLGFVQLDSINTVARAHDLTLFARKPRYRPNHLKKLYEHDRALFEHWTHDAAMIPIEFYPHWSMRRTRDAEKLRKQWRSWRRDGFEAQLQAVQDHIRAHGPCGSSDVGQNEARGSGGWWDWHPSKTALEYLWRTGVLHVVGREGFQKQYDLAERALPVEVRGSNRTMPDSETIDWFCMEALQRLGFGTSGNIAAFWGHLSAAEAKAWGTNALKEGRITEIDVTGDDGSSQRCLTLPDLHLDSAVNKTAPDRLRVLSPFDPALRDRKRAKFLFGFDYRIEVFVPEAKRVFGYYVFPLLQGERIVGRVDMKAFRAEDVLRVRAVWPEAGVRWGAGRCRAFQAELGRIKHLAGVRTVAFEEGWLRPSKQHQFG